jgi:short-subunit dehydrogenase
MIVVTAPTSNIGRQLLANILDSGERIRVIARDPSRLPAQTRERVEVIEGSHSQVDVVSREFEGADSVFWLVPTDLCRVRIICTSSSFTKQSHKTYFASHDANFSPILNFQPGPSRRSGQR